MQVNQRHLKASLNFHHQMYNPSMTAVKNRKGPVDTEGNTSTNIEGHLAVIDTDQTVTLEAQAGDISLAIDIGHRKVDTGSPIEVLVGDHATIAKNQASPSTGARDINGTGGTSMTEVSIDIGGGKVILRQNRHPSMIQICPVNSNLHQMKDQRKTIPKKSKVKKPLLKMWIA